MTNELEWWDLLPPESFVSLQFTPEEEASYRDFCTVRDFLEFCIRLTGEPFAVNPSIAAHFRFLGVPSSLFTTKELPYDARFELSFNV